MARDDEYDEESEALMRDELKSISAEIEARLGLNKLDPARLMELARHRLLIKLITLVEADMASPADRNCLRQLLKDNGMILGDPLNVTQPGEQAKAQPADLPLFDRPDWHN